MPIRHTPLVSAPAQRHGPAIHRTRQPRPAHPTPRRHGTTVRAVHHPNLRNHQPIPSTPPRNNPAVHQIGPLRPRHPNRPHHPHNPQRRPHDLFLHTGPVALFRLTSHHPTPTDTTLSHNSPSITKHITTPLNPDDITTPPNHTTIDITTAPPRTTDDITAPTGTTADSTAPTGTTIDITTAAAHTIANITIAPAGTIADITTARVRTITVDIGTTRARTTTVDLRSGPVPTGADSRTRLRTGPRATRTLRFAPFHPNPEPDPRHPLSHPPSPDLTLPKSVTPGRALSTPPALDDDLFAPPGTDLPVCTGPGTASGMLGLTPDRRHLLPSPQRSGFPLPTGNPRQLLPAPDEGPRRPPRRPRHLPNGLPHPRPHPHELRPRATTRHAPGDGATISLSPLRPPRQLPLAGHRPPEPGQLRHEQPTGHQGRHYHRHPQHHDPHNPPPPTTHPPPHHHEA
ncbi:hypothetical protein Misp01_71560 [Microtetraspora sp. NBRC 13810]|nr:hypothetical protein Misp01_71560 [Microtetraspora sp. NBRC 13810]